MRQAVESTFKSIPSLDFILFVTEKSVAEVDPSLGVFFKHVDRNYVDLSRDLHLYACVRVDVLDVSDIDAYE